jgi:hypothetical protein
MTIEKEKKEVVIPVFWFNILITLLIAGVTTWGVISARTATTEVRLEHIEQNMKTKVGVSEFQMVCDELREIKRILMEDRK